MIYLDHNATTRPLPAAVQAMTECLLDGWGNPSSMHTRGMAAKHRLNRARGQAAALIGASPAEIVFTGSATEANHTAILGALALAAASAGKRRIVASRVEHPSTLALLTHLEQQGIEIAWLEVDGNGQIDPAAIEAALTPDTALLTLMWANNETGVLLPVEQAAAMAKAHGVLFHTDAVQAAGKVKVDMTQTPADLLSLSAHKLHGPPGVGALFVRKGLALPPVLFGHQERKRRGGTENLPGIVGFGVAAEHLAATWRDEAPRLAALRERFERGLHARLPMARINGGAAQRLCNTSNFAIDGLEAEALLDRLDKAGIYASSGSACTAGGTEPSHVLRAMGQTRDAALAAVRISFGCGNTDAEVNRLLDLLPAIVAAFPGSLATAA